MCLQRYEPYCYCCKLQLPYNFQEKSSNVKQGTSKLTYNYRRRPDRRAPFHFTTNRTNICNCRRSRSLTNREKKVKACRQMNILKETFQQTKTIITLIAAETMGVLNGSKDDVSNALKDLRPTAFTSILNPLSAVVTERRFPSLLNLTRGTL